MQGLLRPLGIAIASSALGAKFAKHTFHRLDNWVFNLSNGRHTLVSLLVGLPVVTVTTIGAKSGLPRTLPLLFTRETPNSEGLYLIASNFGNPKLPAWYHNMKANPTVTATIKGQTASYTAIEIPEDDPRYAHIWQQANQVYQGYDKYKKRVTRRIPIMYLEPQ